LCRRCEVHESMPDQSVQGVNRSQNDATANCGPKDEDGAPS